MVTAVMSSGVAKLPNRAKSSTDAAGRGLDGSVMSIICMPSRNAATMAYVDEPNVTVAILSG